LNRQKLTELILHPEQISQRESSMLQDMAAQYPYATAIQIMLAKSKQQQANARHQLATAALYSPNRGILRQVMENTLPAIEQSLTARPAANAVIVPAPDQDVDTTADLVSAPQHAIPPSASSEQPPQSKEDVFEELQKNLRRLRETRIAQSSAEDKTPAKQSQAATSRASVQETSAPEETTTRHLSPALQQVVNEHQQQPLENPRVQEQRSLIDSFLENAASIQRRQPLSNAPEDLVTDLSQNVSLTPPDLATETLALIMERQGKTDKAIDIYQKLVLKYPQKSAYFADCIERLKKISR
jgi:hypothetical protein